MDRDDSKDFRGTTVYLSIPREILISQLRPGSLQSEMLSLRGRGDAVKAEMPKELYMAIVKLQAAEELDWREACIKAARLINSNSEEFKRLVQLEAERLYKQRFMRQLNKARETVRSRAWEEAREWIRRTEDNFRVPCSICGKPMYFSSTQDNWEAQVKPTLYNAFKDWHHTACAK
jgi:Zn-dependent M32 family carboxypeptidase